MVSVNTGDVIDDSHYFDLIQQLVDNYSTVLAQPLLSARATPGEVDDNLIEDIAVDIATWYHHLNTGLLSYFSAYDALFSGNLARESVGSKRADAVGLVINHEDINQCQQAIDTCNALYANGAPRLVNLPGLTASTSFTDDIPDSNDAETVTASIAYRIQDGFKTFTINKNGATSTTNLASSWRYFSELGGRIQIQCVGFNSDGGDKDNDVKSMIDKLNATHNPYPLSNTTFSDTWNNYTVLDSASGNSTYSSNRVKLAVRRDSNSRFHYAILYTDAEGGIPDESVTTDFNLQTTVRYANKVPNEFIPQKVS